MIKNDKQECIPVGCVPSAAVAVVGEGGDCLGGVFLPGGGVCPGRSAVLLGGGGGLPQCMLGYTPPVNRLTDACENITLPQLRSIR